MLQVFRPRDSSPEIEENHLLDLPPTYTPTIVTTPPEEGEGGRTLLSGKELPPSYKPAVMVSPPDGEGGGGLGVQIGGSDLDLRGEEGDDNGEVGNGFG